MGFYPIKRNRADVLFSDYIRKKASWRCEKCKKVCKVEGVWIASLQASHYHVRNHWNTRYDERNVIALCATCHDRMGEYKNAEDGEYDLFMKERLGERGYKQLKIDANTTAHRDKDLWLRYVKQIINENAKRN